MHPVHENGLFYGWEAKNEHLVHKKGTKRGQDDCNKKETSPKGCLRNPLMGFINKAHQRRVIRVSETFAES